jgi:dolichol-phosphate mannosyltransferase
MLGVHQRDPRFRIIHFSRNFGHQVAITAGIDHARGEAVIIMDADLQDPPEVVHEMAARWREGYEVVSAVRVERQGESWLKRFTAAAFYRLLRRLTDVDIPRDVGDFRLVDRRALETFKAMRESDRYVRGMFGWIGFRHIGVQFVRSERAAGETKYPWRRMLKLAFDGILSFSRAPLRLVLNLGFLVSAVSFLAGIACIVLKLAGVYTVSGWTSMVVAIFFLGGIQLTVMGMIGEYIGRIYEQVKNRPLYVVRRMHGIGQEARARPETVLTAYDALDREAV